jgi:hypothetical protein
MKQLRKTVVAALALVCAVTANAETWTLEKCIDYALTNNLTVRSRALDVRNAELDVTAAKDAFLPEVGLSASQSFNLGRGLTSENTYADRNTSNFQWGANLSVPLFQGLGNVRRLDYAKASLLAVVEEFEAAKEDVTLNVIAQYLQVLYCNEVYKVALEQIELSDYELKRQQALLEAGKVPEIDMLNARSQLAQDELSATTAKNDYTLALVDLAQLLRLDDIEGFEVASLDDDNVLMRSADEVFANAKLNNSSVNAGRLRIAAADKNIRVAKSGYMPRLSFTAGIGSSYYTVSGFDNDKFGHQMKNNFSTYFGFNLSIPVFDAFSTRNNVRRARVSRLSAELQYETACDNLYKAVQQAYYSALGAAKRLESSTVAEDATEKTFAATREKYNLGRATPTDYETAKNNYLRAVSDRVRAKYEYMLRTRILDFYNSH